jgi:hypothetical protein
MIAIGVVKTTNAIKHPIPTRSQSISIELDKILKDITIIEWSNDNELLWDKLRMVIFSDLY